MVANLAPVNGVPGVLIRFADEMHFTIIPHETDPKEFTLVWMLNDDVVYRGTYANCMAFLDGWRWRGIMSGK